MGNQILVLFFDFPYIFFDFYCRLPHFHHLFNFTIWFPFFCRFFRRFFKTGILLHIWYGNFYFNFTIWFPFFCRYFRRFFKTGILLHMWYRDVSMFYPTCRHLIRFEAVCLIKKSIFAACTTPLFDKNQYS